MPAESRQVRQKVAPLAQHPVQPAIRLALHYLLACRQMQIGQQFADLHAMLSIRFTDVLARQARLQQRRFA